MTISVTVLKEHDYAQWAVQRRGGEAAGNLGPYSLDQLEHGPFRLLHSDAHLRAPWSAAPVRRPLGWVERRLPATAGARNVLANRKLIAEADVTLAIFENQGSFAALARQCLPFAKFAPRRLAIVSCWMADAALTATPRHLREMRAVLRGADCVFCLSSNQVEIYRDLLRVPPERIAVVAFGIDCDFFTRPQGYAEGERGFVLAVGRDRGRDHQTLVEAVAGTGIRTVVVSPHPLVIAASEVEHVRRTVSHLEYRELLWQASIVAVPTHSLAYPGGQTVLLEAMAAGCPVIASDTAAIRDYVEDGVDGVTVPVGDAGALRQAIEALRRDRVARERLGTAAAASARARFSQQQMWRAIGDRLRTLVPE